MWGHKRSEAPLTAPSQPAAMDPGEVLSAAWKSLSKTKAALRHIENRLEASPGTGVLLDSVMENKKTSGGATRKVSRRDGRNAANPTHSGPDSKTGATGRRGSEKRSRSPLRVTTLGDNVRRTNCVEFKEPLASYREPTPPPLTPSQLEARSLLSEVPPSVCNDSRLSQLGYQRDTRDQQTHVLDSTCSSTLDSTVVRYLNDRPALDALCQPAWPARTDGPGGKGKTSNQEAAAAADASQSSSPGSSSRRLESLRRKQPDEKLEKLKDRIRRQREHLEEAVDGERALGAGGGANANASAPTAKVRKVAAAPPAPIYKGFNPSETKIRTPDGKVWREEEFQKLSRDIYRDLSLQLSENAKMKQRPAESEREKKPSKPVRKVHKSAPLPSAEIKPAAPSINTASWREGQKLVKMVLGPAPRVPREPMAEPAERAARKGPPHRTKSDSRPGSTERPLSRAPSNEWTGETQPMAPAPRPEDGEERSLLVKDLLPPDIRDILDDLQLEGSAEGLGQKEGRNGGGLPTAARARARSRGSRSASPAVRRQDTVEAGPKRRHYDTDSVRQYITRQQEERRRRQQEERKAQREEAERRNKRLQELYRKQRETVSRAPEAPAQKRMQETYTELMLEQARLAEELPQPLPVIDSLQPKPLYQPSGESDKENRRLDRPQSASSSSDLSLSEPQPPQLTRDELAHSRLSWMQSDCFSSLAPPMDHRFTQRLDPDSGMSGLQRELQQPWAQNVIPTAAAKKSKMNRIEALKATAASLSTRIETEARKLAGAGINYGCSRGGSDVDTGLPPQPQDDGRWAKLVSPPVREALEPPDLELRVQRLLSAAQTAYGETLPGVGNLHTFRNPKDRDAEADRPHLDSPAFISQNRPVEGLEARVSLDSDHDRPLGFHDSSGDSISEGPLMSEGSLSEGDSSPQAGTSRFPGPAERIRAPEHCAARQDVSRPAFQFQREAERLPPFDSLSHLLESRGPWEELAKGSPHSVISIFTKHLPSNSKGMGKMDGSPPPLLSASPVDKSGYEDDFVSSRSSGGSNQSGKRGSSALGSGSRENSPHIDLLSRRSPYTSRTIDQLSYHSSVSSPVSSPRSAASVHKTVNDTSEESVLERTLVEGQKRPSSNASEPLSQESRRSSPGKSSSISVSLSADTDGTLGGISGHSPLCLESDGRKTPKSPAVSPSGSPAGSGSQKSSPDRVTSAGRERPNVASSPSQSVRSAVPVPAFNEHGAGGSSESKTKGELHYTPGVLQQRMTAELGYLDTMEESVRQLCDMERLRSVSLAQQESVSLAQVIKSQQLKHEHDLFLLKLKTEREELDTKRQLEEAQQRAARARVELQENMAQSRQESLGGLQDATTKMIGQQAEAVRFTADAARHIKEMTELARSQIAEALSVPAAPITTLFDQQRQHNQAFMKQLQSPPPTDSRKTAGSPGRTRSDATLSSLESTPRSPPFRTPTISASRSSSTSPQVSPSLTSSGQKSDGPVRKERAGSSVEEEARTAADDSIRSDSAPSLLDEKDSASVTTEYSLKFDESIVEGETEERSFRSLLPSESHRRFSLDKKRDSLEDSEEECRLNKSSLLDASKQQDGSVSFSSGQDSFSRFTMDMVRQYMKEEEVRAQHQSSLLRLREKALKEKTKAELAWLEHQKRHLRNKGEDDKMPPIRKRQRGLLLRLQQEQVEIKRLHDANKAARKERQLLLKQQEDIERMRHTTLKLKERLKSAGETGLEAAVSDPTEKPVALTPTVTDLETRSTSPVSVSGSETSSIMQKLKKMRCHMDEKHCSPVHYFFSVFTAHHWASLSVCFPNLHPKFQLFIYNQLVRFLTKREQQLVQRRRYAEELLQWKRRLDAEEAEVRRMEEQALAAWDGGRPRDRRQRRESPVSAGHHSPEGVTERERVGSLQGKTERGREPISESSCSPVVTISSLPAEDSVQEELGSASTDHPVSELPSPHKEHSQEEDSVYSQEFDSTSDNKLGSSSKPSLSASRQPGSSRMQLWSSSKSTEPWSGEPQSVSQSEATSDQSDVECRIRALKQELRQRKSVVHQLKKEQKKRHKERLKAQEASLLKQLESYNDFIQKTKAELDKEPDATPTTKPQIKTRTSATEKPRFKPPPLQSKNWKSVSDAEKGVKVQSDSPTEHAISENLTPSGFTLNREDGASDEDPATVTPTPVLGSPEHLNTFENSIPVELQPRSLYEDTEGQDKSGGSLAVDSEESIISSHKFEVLEELEHRESDNDRSHSRSEELFSEPLLKLDQELQPPSPQQRSPTEDRLPKSSPEKCEPGLSRVNEENKIESSTEDEDLRSASAIISRPECAAEESKGEDDQSPEGSSSIKERPHSHDSDIQSPGRETLAKNREESPPPPADSYRDDFESSVESSPQQGYLGTQSTSPAARGKDQGPYSRSPLYSTEEEISEDLSEKSSSSSGGCLSEGLLDLNSLPKDSIVKEAGDTLDTLSPKQSPVTSRPQTPTSQTLDEMPDFSIGDRVLVSNVQPGTLRFKGPTRFANGFWAGVELDKSEGSNNGTYDGVVYFECEEDHGIFAPPDKISQLPEKFETYVDSTEDEDSFFDEASDNETKKQFGGKEELSRQDQKDDKSERDNNLQDKAPSDVSEAPIEHSINQVSSEKDPFLIPEVVLELDDLKSNSAKKINGSQHLTPNGKSMDIILELEDASACDYDLLISEVATRKQALEKVVSTPLLDLLAREDKAHQKPFLDASQEKIPIEKLDSEKKEKPNISALSDQLLNVFVKDAVKQFQQIKKDRNEKILASNQLKGHNDIVDNWVVRETSPLNESPYSAQLDGLPSFEEGQAEVSSPELCVRPESPVLGASGQELAKRLAELELSRELFDVLGDEQDWFDEDFGLSSKKEQQNQQQQQQQQEEVVLDPTRTEEESRAKTPVKPEPPRQAKPPEEPVMVVPHTVPEVEQLAHAATQLIWKSCNLGQGRQSLAGVPTPVAPDDYLGCNAKDQGRESLSSRSYRQAVFDLTWEIIQEIYAEDPSVHQPLWLKPYRTSSSYFRRVKSPGDITEVQAFVTNEVLKLFGLKKDQNQKTDWQKMLKFGRKKRDRVDHILVQELHEEESQWVNYDEDELFVKMQLADGIFDALVKDTADVFSQIQEKRVKRCLS